MQDYNFAIKSYPVVLGSDVCGVVTSAGSSVTKFKVGDRGELPLNLPPLPTHKTKPPSQNSQTFLEA